MDESENESEPYEEQEDRFVDISFSVKWRLRERPIRNGFFKLNFPINYPKSQGPVYFDVSKQESSVTSIVTVCAEDFFIDCAFRNGFQHILQYSADPRPKIASQERFVEEKLLVDGNILFLPDKSEVYSTISTSLFDYLTFSISADDSIASDDQLVKFSPAFISMEGIGHIPMYPEYAPPYFIVRYGRKTFNIVYPSNSSFDCVIPIPYRKDENITFEVRNKEHSLPDNLVGTGLYKPYIPPPPEPETQSLPKDEVKLFETQNEETQEEQTPEEPKEEKSEERSSSKKHRHHKSKDKDKESSSKKEHHHKSKEKSSSKKEHGHKSKEKKKSDSNSKSKTKSKSQCGLEFGYCEFSLLPERTRKLVIKPSDCDTSGDFDDKTTEIVFRIVDPGSYFPNSVDPGPIPRPSVEKTKPNIIDTHEPTNDEKILKLDKPSATFYRWIFTCSRDDGGWNYAHDILELFDDHHTDVLSRRGPIRGPIAFPDAFRRSIDLITGFHFMTPNEQVIVVETRVKEPKKATTYLNSFLQTLPCHVHILGNPHMKFPAPRLYCLLDQLVKKVNMPIPMKDLIRIEGLYYQHHVNHKFYSPIMKLKDLLTVKSIAEAVDADIFPTSKEIKLLYDKSELLSIMPLYGSSIETRTFYRPVGSDFAVKPPDEPFVVEEIDIPDFLNDVKPAPPPPPPPVCIPMPKDRLTNYSLTMPISFRAESARRCRTPRISVEHWYNDPHARRTTQPSIRPLETMDRGRSPRPKHKIRPPDENIRVQTQRCDRRSRRTFNTNNTCGAYNTKSTDFSSPSLLTRIKSNRSVGAYS